MGQSVEQAFTTIDTRLTQAERQARSFRAPILSGAHPEDLGEGVLWGRSDLGDGKGVPHVQMAGTTHQISTDQRLVVPVKSGADPTLSDGVTWSRPDQGTNGVPYHRTAATTHRVLTSLTSKPMTADVYTSQSTQSTGYTDLATVGPTLQVTASGTLQQILIIVQCEIWSSATGHWGFMSWELSDVPYGGSYTFSAGDASSCRVKIGTAQADQSCSRFAVFGLGSADGSPRDFLITCVYRSGDATKAVVFENRRLTVIKM